MSNTGKNTERPNGSRTPTTIVLVGFVLVVAGGVTARFAPDLFASLGGWVTVVVIAALAVLLGSYAMIRVMRRNASTPDDAGR